LIECEDGASMFMIFCMKLDEFEQSFMSLLVSRMWTCYNVELCLDFLCWWQMSVWVGKTDWVRGPSTRCL